MAKRQSTKAVKDENLAPVVQEQEPQTPVIEEEVKEEEPEVVENNMSEALEKMEETVPETTSEEAEEAEKDAAEINATIDDFNESQDMLEKKLDEHPEQAEKILKDEIAKVEKMKNNVEKMTKKYSNAQISNSWNGMIQDW